MLKRRCLKNIQACRPLGVLGSRCTSQRTAELDGNGDFCTGSAEGNRLMNRGSSTIGYHRVCVWMLKHRCLDNVQACSPSDVCSARVNRELQRRARSNGYSTTVSAEGNRLMNKLVPHHRAVSGVPRDTQTSACRSHESVQTLVCVIGSDEQRVTDTSSE